MSLRQLPEITLSHSALAVLRAAEEEDRLTLVGSVEELLALAVPEEQCDAQGYYTVGYDVPGTGFVPEAQVCRVRNGIAVNYPDPYMRRRDADCMVIGDEGPTDKPTFRERFGKEFAPLRKETLEWLKTQPLACFFFESGLPGRAMNAVAICPANAGFFALGLAMLQGIIPLERIRQEGPKYHHQAILYTAPVFRHTHFGGKQVVVHNRRFEEAGLHELFSYNLYPGPSAKKGVYGMLLTAGERGEIPWTTAHCSTVQATTPEKRVTVIMHEGASGSGKSEMLEAVHREPDGRLRLGTNVVTNETKYVTLPQGCELRPVTDDMALCHPDLQKRDSDNRKLSLIDAEQGWFVRVNHIQSYGTDPALEKLAIHPPGPLLFLNMQAKPGATTLIWEHIEDKPGVRCPDPQLVIPRNYIPGVVKEAVTVDIRSFGIRCPPCTREAPTYGIVGMFHVLPPALAWLWRLVAPRGHGNPSIVSQDGMQSEGVGSYWPFATGRRVDQANILLHQIMDTSATLFALIPNQHIGAWQVGFAPQWISRECLARAQRNTIPQERLVESRCALLGYHPRDLQLEGQTVERLFFDVSAQPEVGVEVYDAGAAQLTEFFHEQLSQFRDPELDPLGKQMITACLDGASIKQYEALTQSLSAH